MSEPKANCTACGAEFLQRTADEYGGLCIPCHRRAAKPMPDDYEVPADLSELIASAGKDPKDYRETAWFDQAGVEGGKIEKLERELLYSLWSPRLHEYAKKCREENRPPTEDSLSNSDREKQRIYGEQFLELTPFLIDRDTTVIIFEIPLVAVPVAHRLWAKNYGHVVVISPEEDLRWREIYTHSENTSWINRRTWCIDDSPDSKYSAEVPEGEHPWLLTYGHYIGPLSEGGCTELWSWNGERATRVNGVDIW